MYIGQIEQMYEDGESDKEAILKAYGEFLEEKAGDGGIDAPPISGELKLGVELAFLAAKYTHPEALEYLFGLGVEPNCADDLAFTLLHAAAKRNYHYYKPVPGDVEKTVNLLLDRGVSALRKDENERMCCYHYAARSGLWEFVAALAKRGTKLGMTDKEGNTGIHIAADYVRHQIAHLGFAEKGLAFQQEHGGTDKYALEALEDKKKEIAESNERIEDYFITVKAFVDAAVDPDEKNQYEKSAKDFAVKGNANKIAAFLAGDISGDEADAAKAGAGTDTELKLAAGGKDFFDAIIGRDYKALEALIKLGTDLNGLYSRERENNFTGLSPLGVACSMVDSTAALLLLEAGADPAFRDAHGRAALSYYFSTEANVRLHSEILSEGHPQKTLAAFVEKGFEVNAPVNDEGDTLLVLACKSIYGGSGYNNHSLKGVIIAELIKYKADPNAANNNGETALMWICGMKEMENYVISFLEAGADPSHRDKNGNAALQYAAMNSSGSDAKTLSELLLDFGADPKAVNNDGKTALDIATEKNNEPLVKLLLKKM
jgi:ankyrin repeat protein